MVAFVIRSDYVQLLFLSRKTLAVSKGQSEVE